jgi:cytochrome c-type biogenesis protein CcmH
LGLLALAWLASLRAEPSRARRIEERFIAPCCWRESVAVHRSEVATGMRAEIERMVAQGASEDQIVDSYVVRYGEKILMEPRGAARIWLTTIPLGAIAMATAGLAVLFIRRRREPPGSTPGVDAPPCLEELDLD